MTNPADLKNIGLKATLPRLKILEIFQHSPVRHLTAEDVYRNLLNEDLDIGLATVYRVLTQFEQAGHDHLVCLDCGLVEEFFDPEIEKRQQMIANERGFKLQEHALALYGACTKENCPHRKH